MFLPLPCPHQNALLLPASISPPAGLECNFPALITDTLRWTFPLTAIRNHIDNHIVPVMVDVDDIKTLSEKLELQPEKEPMTLVKLDEAHTVLPLHDASKDFHELSWRV